MYRTFRYRLYPTQKQSDNLRLMLEDHCDLYNAALQERRDAYRHSSKTSITYTAQSVQLPAVRAWDPDQKRWSANSQQETLRRLDRTFQAFFRRVKNGEAPGYPRFKSKKRFSTVVFNNGAGGGSWIEDQKRIYVKGVGHVKIALHRSTQGTIKQFSVTRAGNKWYVSAICRDVPKRIRPLTGAIAGIDRGVTHLIADSDGGLHENPRYFQNSEERLAEKQRELKEKKKFSNRWRKTNVQVAKLHRRIASQRRDYLHKKSRQLVDIYDLIVMEDLKIRNMTRSASGTVENPGTNVAQKSGLNKAILDSGWGVLQNMLTYKAEEAGVDVVLVNPRNTSRTCYSCGNVDSGNRVKEAFRCLQCGHIDHADVNAAKNILRLGLSLQAADAA